jgi:hypothetical protein
MPRVVREGGPKEHGFKRVGGITKKFSGNPANSAFLAVSSLTLFSS